MSADSLALDAATEARALRRRANELLQSGHAEAALEHFDRALSLCPGDPATLNDKGNALQDLRRFAEAIASYTEALRVKADFAAAFTNRSNALRALARFHEALQDLDAALRLKPTFPETLNSRGCVLRELGRLEEALASFDAALALKPEFVIAHCNRGNTLLELRRPRDALTCFDSLLQHLPEDGEALFGRASALLQLRESLELAAADFARAADQGISRSEALVGRAACLAGLQRHSEAAACLTTLLDIVPDREYVRGSLLHSLLQSCQWERISELTAELAALIAKGERATHPLSLLSLIDSPELQMLSARAHVEDQYRANDALGPCGSRKASGARRLRIAYISADFCEHPVSHLLVGVLERHDRTRFEVIGVSLQAGTGGAFERRVRGAFDRFVEVTRHTDFEAARLLRALDLDIAVDLMGFTQGLRLGIFSYRCAPVQVGYLGYAGTTGAPYIDYLLADDVVIPRGDERYYTERVIRLPHCYLPNDDRREIGTIPTRSQAGLPERGFVFCAFTSTYKINPPIFSVWMRLLRGIRDSVLWLRSVAGDARVNLERAARAHGVDPARMVFAPHVASMADHLGRQALADLYLDTVPYNAHSTACDALWAGVPVLTCAGRSFASRVAASALAAVGLPELVTQSLEQYEKTALELARDPARLEQLRARLRQHRIEAPLFDTARYCRDLEAAFRLMHEEVAGRVVPVGGPTQVSAQVDALVERGNLLRDSGRPAPALESFEKALALEPECLEALCNRGNALADLGRFQEAVESYDRVLQRRPDLVDVWANRATVLQELGRHAEAADCLERVVRLAPKYDYALGRLLQARLDLCSWTDYSRLRRQAEADLREGRRVIHPFSALAVIDSPALQLRAAELHAGHGGEPQPGVGVGRQPRQRQADEKIRIAYVSADFREHAASYLMAGVFERHERRHFETYAISLLPPEDSPMGKRVRAAFDHFVDVSSRSDTGIAALMRDMEVDIAIDLMGYTRHARPGIFTQRAAPVQVSYLGYPGTLGARCMDYLIADERVIPPDQARHYAERVVYLPDCFQANDDRCVVGEMPTRAAAGLPSQGLVLCCFNSSYKLTPPVFDSWMRVLDSVPESFLWLLADKPEVQENLRREARARNVDAQRLVFAGKVPYAQHLGRLALADLFLDTSPYNAGTTASDALRVGVPVLTCAGQTFAARMAGSLLTALGLPQLVTHSLPEYEQALLELARDPARLASLRARLAANLTRCSVFDTTRFCRHLEAAYVGMHERSIRGEPPSSFTVRAREQGAS